MARTKQPSGKRESGAARGQRRPSRMPHTTLTEAGVSKREPYANDFTDPGSRLITRFNKKKDRLLVKSLHLIDGQSVSLEGIKDMAEALDDLKAYINRAYAKEKWKDYDFDSHEIKSISMKDCQLGLVLDDEQPDYDPDEEPVLPCTVKTGISVAKVS